MGSNRKDEVHAFKIKALQDREYRNKLVILEAEARLTRSQSKIPPTVTPKPEEFSSQATL